MNTEPPTGDDLQQMLVTMKQNVLARAELDRPAPKRRGRRTGIIIGVIAVLGIGAGSGAVALGMVHQPFTAAPAPSPAPTTPSQTPTPSSAPVVNEPTATPSVVDDTGVIPTDCRAAVPRADYDRLFGSIPLEDPAGTSFGTDTPDLVPDMNCVWIDPQGDGSFLTIGFGKRDAAGDEWVGSMDGWTCADRDRGRSCQITHPSDMVETLFWRGDTWVRVLQLHVPTNGLLDAVEQQVWG